MLSRELSSLAKQTNYLCPERYKSGYIIEYDISQANINILKKYNQLSDKDYNYLKSIPKINREIIIGNMIKGNKDLFKIIQKGIKESKVNLFDSNNIKGYEVVRIASDAVYINRTSPLQYTTFDNIEFKIKSISNSYLKLKDILFFINYENNNINVDIKGLGEDYSKHESLISFICNIICELEFDGIKPAMNSLEQFIDDYINKRLDVLYYREFNSRGLYNVSNSGFYLDMIDVLSPEIDINYNLYLLRELSSILYEIYISTYRNL